MKLFILPTSRDKKESGFPAPKASPGCNPCRESDETARHCLDKAFPRDRRALKQLRQIFTMSASAVLRCFYYTLARGSAACLVSADTVGQSRARMSAHIDRPHFRLSLPRTVTISTQTYLRLRRRFMFFYSHAFCGFIATVCASRHNRCKTAEIRAFDLLTTPSRKCCTLFAADALTVH